MDDDDEEIITEDTDPTGVEKIEDSNDPTKVEEVRDDEVVNEEPIVATVEARSPEEMNEYDRKRIELITKEMQERKLSARNNKS